MTHIPFSDEDQYDEFETEYDRNDRREAQQASRRQRAVGATSGETPSPRRNKRVQRPPRTERDQAFKCGHCRQFIGAPASGGRHRNHCPNCLHSKHVDDKMPGDRRSDCHSSMAPAGITHRSNGEQMILHRCLGCGKESPNRIAADDNPSMLLSLPLLGLSEETTLEEDDYPEFAAPEITIASLIDASDEDDRWG